MLLHLGRGFHRVALHHGDNLARRDMLVVRHSPRGDGCHHHALRIDGKAHAKIGGGFRHRPAGRRVHERVQRVGIGVFAQHRGNAGTGTIAPDVDMNGRADVMRDDRAVDRALVAQVHAVQAEDHVPHLQFGRQRRTVRLDRGNDGAPRAGQDKTVRQIGGQRLQNGAQPGRAGAAVFFNLRAQHPRIVDRDGEADADRSGRSRNGQNGGVDANHFAGSIEQRAAGIALVDLGIGLQEMIEPAHAEIAVERADDAG